MKVWQGYEEHAVAPIRPAVFQSTLNKKPETQEEAILTVNSILTSEFFAFIKVFDSDLDENSNYNFYMEREWRMINPFAFRFEDIASIIVPKQYREVLSTEFPLLDTKIVDAPTDLKTNGGNPSCLS